MTFMKRKAPKNNELEGKHKPSLIPWDIIIEMCCPAYLEGTIKYVRESWRHGFEMSNMYDACQRHLTKFFYLCEDYDQETWETYKIKKHHLGAAIFCIISMYWTQKIGRKDLDDRPHHVPLLTGPDLPNDLQEKISALYMPTEEDFEREEMEL